MKLDIADLEPDDIRIIASPDKFKREIAIEDTRLSMDIPISIKYDYLDLGITAYHFKQEFHLKDTQCYFEMMKKISSNTINSLLTKSREYHFYRNDIKGNLQKALKRFFPEIMKSSPIIFHFALYIVEKAEREKDIRSPRIYFMLGTNGFIYPLFFDPYHEINP